MERLYSKITFTPAPKAEDHGRGIQAPSTDAQVLKNYNDQLFTALNQPKDGEPERQTIVFDFVNEVEIDLSHKELTGTASITIPRKLTFDGESIATGTSALFRRNDKVKIELGYFPELTTVFEGYVANVSINSPIVIECEDEMFQLQKKHVLYPSTKDIEYRLYGKVNKKTGKARKLSKPKIVAKKMKLSSFIRDVVLDGTPYGATARFGNVEMEIAIKRFDCSAREVLNKLKETFPGFYAYFQDGALNVGFLNDATSTVTHEFHFEEDIIDDTRLEFMRQDDVQLVVRATSYDVDTGDQVTVTWPEDVGPATPSAHVDVFTAKKMTKADLEVFARKNAESRKYSGYRGSFITFGSPYVRPGDAARLIDTKYAERNGTYAVQSVKRTFGMGGYRQTIELGVRLTQAGDPQATNSREDARVILR